MTPVTIRPATAADYDRYIDAFEAVAAEGRWMGAEAPLDREKRRPVFDQAVAGEGGALFLAERRAGGEGEGAGGEIIGAVNAFGQSVVDIGMFVVADQRAAGVGTALLEAAVAWAREQGAHKVSLAVWATNFPAQALYSKFGFHVEGRRRQHYRRRSGELWDSLVMGLLLDDETGPALALPEGGLTDGDLTVRPWRTADTGDLIAAVSGDLDISEWLPNIPQPYSADDASAFLALTARGLMEGTSANWAVTRGGRLTGAVNLSINHEDPKVVEIGYWTAAAARGQGTTTRAVQAVSAWAAQALVVRRIELYAAAGNTASRGVAERAGFEMEGTLRSWRLLRGQPTDFVLYALIPSIS